MNERALDVGFQPPSGITDCQKVYEQAISKDHSLAHYTHLVCQYVALNHFGAEPALDPNLLRFGCESGCAHYLGTNGGDINWFSALPDTLLLTLLFADENSQHELCSWFSLDLEPVYHGMLDIHVELIYLLVCNHCSEHPSDPGVVVDRVASARAKHPRLLLALWQAALGSSQKDYTKAMKLSLKHFSSRKKPDLDATYPSEWVAMAESVIHQVAMQNGHDLEGVPQALRSLVVTKGTLNPSDLAAQTLHWAAMVPESHNSELLSEVALRADRLDHFNFVFAGPVIDYELFNLPYVGPAKHRRSLTTGQLFIFPVGSAWIDTMWSSVAGVDKMGFYIPCPRPESSELASVTSQDDGVNRIAIAKTVGEKLTLLIVTDDEEQFPEFIKFMESLTVASP